LDDVCIFDYESISDCMIKLLLALAYPSVCLLCVLYMRFFSFCNDHQPVDVSKCENYPWSLGWWRFRCLVDWTWALLFMSFSRAMAHVFLLISAAFLVTIDLVPCLVLASWCVSGFPFFNSWISLRSESLLCIFARIIILCDMSFK